METTDFYQQLLKPPAPWCVSRVVLSLDRVDIWLDHPDGSKWPCQVCGNKCSVYDHTDERSWRHLNTCERQTWIHAKLPRTKCDKDGIRQVKAPLSSPRSNLTFLMEHWTIDVLQECNRKGTVKLTELTWDQVDLIMQRAVERGLERREEKLPTVMGIDEKSVFKRHKYCTIITNIEEGTVYDVINARTKDVVEPWFKERSELCPGIEKVAMDMSAGYAGMVTRLTDADICFDHFHVTQKVLDAVNEVRKLEQKNLPDEIDKTDFFRSRFLFLYNEENVPPKRVEQFERLKRIALKTSRAWAIKENLRELWNCTNLEDAEEFFKKWFWWATHSRLEPMRKAAHTLKNHWTGIANAIVHKITNACTEGLNSKMEKVKRDAYGFRSKERFRIAALFYCGGLAMYPKS